MTKKLHLRVDLERYHPALSYSKEETEHALQSSSVLRAALMESLVPFGLRLAGSPVVTINEGADRDQHSE